MTDLPTVWHVYRVHDAAGRLIYVGCSENLPRRLRQHLFKSWWWPQAATVVSQAYSTKIAAREAERVAIQTERPRWNRLHRWELRDTFTQQEWLDYIEATERAQQTGWVRSHLLNVRRNYTQRFEQVAS